MSPEYLFSIPIDVLNLYIKFFNIDKEEEERAIKKASQRRLNPP